MKAIIYFLAFLVIMTSSVYSQKIDKIIYKTYKKVSYADLPDSIKIIMKNIGCGEIGAEPSQNNDYKTNYDEGYIIDLNNDNIPEYVFSCLAGSHGPGEGNIFSLIKGKWQVIYRGFPVFVNEHPEICIKVLKTKNEGYHDLLRDDLLTYRKVIIRYIHGSYYKIYTADEIQKEISFYFNKDIKNSYFGISNDAKNEMLKRSYNQSDDYKTFYAVDRS